MILVTPWGDALGPDHTNFLADCGTLFHRFVDLAGKPFDVREDNMYLVQDADQAPELPRQPVKLPPSEWPDGLPAHALPGRSFR